MQTRDPSIRSVALLLAGLGAVLALGCDDSVSSAGGGDMIVADVAPEPEPQPDMAPMPEPEPEADAAPPPAPEPAFIELGLDPRRGLYTREETPQVTVTVYDRIGREIDAEGLLYFDVQPPGQAEINDDLTLNFLLEGQGAVRGCVTSDLCGRVSFFVDDAPPVLELITPARGDVVSGEPVIGVTGRTDPAPNVPRVFVNDLEVEVADDGTFVTELRAELGLNRIDVIADDGVRRPPTRIVREVVWAPEVLVPDADGVTVEQAVVLRLDQTLLDNREAPPEPDEMGAVTVQDMASVVELFLSRLELIGLVDDPVISDSDDLRLVIEAIRPGTPDVAITLVPDGMEVFLRLEDIAIVTSGFVALEGENFDLGGEVRITAAAFAGITVEPGPNGEPVLRVGDIGVAVEALGGVMNDSTAQALLDTVGSLVRTVINSFADELIADVVADQVPEFIELGLGDALGPLANIPLDIEEPAVALDLSFTLADPHLARDAMTLELVGRISQRMPVEPPHPSPGIPAVGLGADPIWPVDAGLGVAVRLLTVNALLDAVWRQGALQLDLTNFLPPEVSALISGGRVDARIPPLVVPGARGGPYAFEVQVGELDLYLESNINPEPDHYTLSLRAGLILQVGEGGIRFDVAEEPDLRIQLIEAGGRAPLLPPEGLERLIGPLAWGEVRNAIGEGLNLAIDPIEIGLEDFQDLAPTLRAVEVVPAFPAPPGVRNGWFVLGAGVDIAVR